MIDLTIVLSASIFNALLGFIVYLRNPKAKVNQLFAFFAISVVTWTLSNYLADNAQAYNLLFTQLTFFFGAIMAFAMYLISNYFPSGRGVNSTRTIQATTLALFLTLLLSLGPWVVTKVTKAQNGVDLHLGPLYGVYVLFMLYAFGMILSNFVRHYRHEGHKSRAQVRILLTGVAIYAGLAIIFNLLLPVVADNWSSSRFGPLFTMAFVGFAAYAIVRHGLLDIRLLVARSVAYTLLISTITGLYIVMIFVIARRIFDEDSVLVQQVLPIVAALFVAATAPYFKRSFDRLTNRFFYRDAYDPQAFLDELNKTLVSNIELGILLRRTAGVIQQNLKSESCFITVRQTDERPFRLLGTDAPKFKADQLAYIYSQMAEMGQKLLIADDVKLEHSKLKRTLNSGGIALVSAPTGYEKDNPALAYLILGPKKSGNIYSKDDLRLIQIITDELVIAIQNALRFEEIQSFNVTLQAKINEATEQLQRNNKKLQVLDQTKDEFISMASHQLRTPLTSIKGYLSMVLDGDAGQVNEEQRKMLQQAFISSQRMTYLISDLLNVSRLRTGKFFIEKAPTNLATVVQQEVDQLRESAKIRGLELNYDQPANFPTIDLDETKTRQVIMNFIDNAIYYTPSGGRIDVALTNKHKSVELTVTDTGIGIAKKEQHRLFSKFYRAPNAKRARPDGTGLGLFMAKKIIVAQGGAIIFHSQPDKGSTFGFSFPKK